jgi:hypothetical protein
VASFLAGAAGGILSAMVVFPMWDRAGWRRPVADWLARRSLAGLAAAWGLVWAALPDWGLAWLISVVLGVAFPRRWIWTAAAAAAGFLLGPHLVMLLVLGGHAWPDAGLKVAALKLLVNLLVVPPVLLGAWLGSRIRTHLEAAIGRDGGDAPKGL